MDDAIDRNEAKKTRPMVFMGRVEILRRDEFRLCFWFCFGKADRALSFFPLTALLEQLDAFKTLEHGTFSAGST